MPRVSVTASALIPSGPATVYGIIADFRDGHPAILPEDTFGELRVLEGGVGEGTVFEVDMTVAGRTQVLRARVTEPRRGHTLVETDLDRGGVTTFTVEPAGEGCTTTIHTTWTTPGLRGWVERLLVPLLLRRTYRRELELLDAVATGRRGSWVKFRPGL